MSGKPLINQKGYFECPVCHSEIYAYVVARRSDGSDRATALYQCGGCSVTFTDPQQFTQCRRLILKKDSSYPGWYAAPADGGPSPAYEGLSTTTGVRKPRREPGTDR
jgi:DNA-directed RNA polymerase subunit RPC12/RpoP